MLRLIRNVGILKHLSLYIPLKTLDQLYKIFVRPHLDYCDIIYHIPPNHNDFDSSLSLNNSMEMIEKVQYQAAMAITGTWQGTNRNKLYEELGWESLSDRRWSRRLFQFFKIQNGLTPSYLTECVPRLRRPLYQNTILNSHHEFRCRTSLFKYSFFPSTVISWNNLESVTRNCLSIRSFKQHLLPLIRPKSRQIFGIHDCLGIKRLFQLRVGLSALKSHKYRHNFQDTQSDLCDCRTNVEDTEHYLLHCPLFSSMRHSLINSINIVLNNYRNMNPTINSDLLLYGHNSLSSDENKNILLSTIKFIKESNRL